MRSLLPRRSIFERFLRLIRCGSQRLLHITIRHLNIRRSHVRTLQSFVNSCIVTLFFTYSEEPKKREIKPVDDSARATKKARQSAELEQYLKGNFQF